MPEEYVETDKDNSKDISVEVEDELAEKRHLGADVPWDSNPGVNVPLGVRSFKDLDAAEAAEEATDEVREDSEKMVQIVSNILNDLDDDNKAESIAKVASEFSTRVADRSDSIKSGNSIVADVVDTLKSVIEDHTKQTCKTEGGVCFPAKDYAFTPDKEKPSTWKLRLSQGKPGNITKAQLGRAAAAFSSGGFRGQKVKIPAANVSSVKARIRREYRKLGVDSSDIPDAVKTEASFMVWKDKSGRYAWLARYSNNFRDDDMPPEIIAAQSHQTFIKSVPTKYDYPELRLWHRQEWIVGKSTWLAWDDTGEGTGFALAAGHFNDGMEGVAESLAKAQDLGVSHGMPRQYLRREKDDRTIITQHVTKEISILPLWSAANRWTEFIVIDDKNKENDMIDDKLREQAKESFGFDDNVISQIEEANAKSAEKNQELGVEFKAKADVTDDGATDSDATTPTDKEKVDVKAKAEGVDADTPLTRKEVADALIGLQDVMVKKVTADVLKQLTPFMDVVKELARDDDERLREKKAATPRAANLSEMLKESVASLEKEDSNISEEEAKKLGSPKETDVSGAGDGTFIGALIEGKGDEHLSSIIKESAESNS